MQIPFLDATEESLELLDGSQEGIWIADNHGRIVFAHRALTRRTDYDGRDGQTSKPSRGPSAADEKDAVPRHTADPGEFVNVAVTRASSHRITQSLIIPPAAHYTTTCAARGNLDPTVVV